MSDSTSCKHVWIANSGRGGNPVFVPAQIIAGDTPVMHVLCDLCKVRTWFTAAQWHALPRPNENRQERRRRLREAAVIARREQERQARLIGHRIEEFRKTGKTYWNGEPASCRRVIVVIGASPVPTWWCAELEGEERQAVEVTQNGHSFLIDDADGSGWAKVTIGRGSPNYGHRGLPDTSPVVQVIS